ncbi:hypothetical protein AYO46_07470 [Betaproteobacteria bacterium SCGC AG-212-J23]|nr:hypothetical protein AYO46_07470 [Betaproteobacteria bacterium SCGC AG-212-J23]
MDRFDEALAAENDRQHAEYQRFLHERQEWERDQAAIREYESWFLQKSISEAEAERISVQE